VRGGGSGRFAGGCGGRWFGGRGHVGSGGGGDWIRSRLSDTTPDPDVSQRHRMTPPDPLTYPTLQTRAAQIAAKKVVERPP
jgi:hypothetical protein